MLSFFCLMTRLHVQGAIDMLLRLDETKMDLVDAVDWYNSEGTQQSYWSLPDTTRQEVKQYRQATRAAKSPPLSVVEETHEDDEVEEDVESNKPCDDDLSQGVNDLTVHEGEQVDDFAKEDAPPPKCERSAAQKGYSDYLKIARRELKEADPSLTSIPHSQVHAHCKALLLEDGW